MPETEIETIRIYVLVFLWFTQILEMYFSGGLKIGVCYYCYIIWYAVCPPAKWSTRETVYSCRPPFIIQKFSALSHVTNSICFVSYLFYTSICIRIVLFMYVRVILFCFNFSYIAFFSILNENIHHFIQIIPTHIRQFVVIHLDKINITHILTKY